MGIWFGTPFGCRQGGCWCEPSALTLRLTESLHFLKEAASVLEWLTEKACLDLHLLILSAVLRCATLADRIPQVPRSLLLHLSGFPPWLSKQESFTSWANFFFSFLLPDTTPKLWCWWLRCLYASGGRCCSITLWQVLHKWCKWVPESSALFSYDGQKKRCIFKMTKTPFWKKKHQSNKQKTSIFAGWNWKYIRWDGLDIAHHPYEA